jgi:hypothetical protein
MVADGKWNLNVTTPMGSQQSTLDIKTNGATVEGEMSGPQGTVPIEEGKIEGDKLSWAITAQQMAMKITFAATINGDAISGEAELGSFGKATFDGARA